MYPTIFTHGRRSAFLALCVSSLACSSSNHHGSGGSGGTPANGGEGATPASGGSGAVGGAKAGSSGGGKGGSSGTAANGGGKGGSGASATGGTGGAAANGGKGGSAAGAAGSAGSGSCSPYTDSGTGAGASVLERSNHASRDAHFQQPLLTKTAAAKLATDSNFKAAFGGDKDYMWATPLYLENGPGGKGVFIAVTTSNNVFALDETSGAVVWTKNIGMPAGKTGAGCGSISPLGIISTPVIDPATRTIYVAGAIGTADGITRHEVHALSAEDGTERCGGWPVDVSTISSAGVKFTPAPQNQRSALSLVNGTVYVAYGGHVGDCGNYHGWVMAIDAKDPSKRGGWATLGTGEAIWAAGGMASDGNGVFAVTGNSKASGISSDHANSDGEEVVRVTGLGTFARSPTNLYFPSSWKTMDSSDADFGASSPMFITVPGATPSTYVLAISKDGHLYLLDNSNLGGMAGHKADFMVSSGTMSIRTVPATYTSASGVHVTFSAVGGAACGSGKPGDGSAAIMSVLIPPGSPPKPSVAWCAARSGTDTSPIVTTTDGKSEPIVWFINSGKLTGLDGETGAVLYTSSDTCAGVRQWTSPIAVKGRIIVGGDKHLCSWSPH
jgi:hypothetical protein